MLLVIQVAAIQVVLRRTEDMVTSCAVCLITAYSTAFPLWSHPCLCGSNPASQFMGTTSHLNHSFVETGTR